MHASSGDERIAKALTAAAISILTKNQEVEITSNGYRLTPSGTGAFRNLGRRGSTRYAFDLKAMDSIRVDVLNWQLRNKRLGHTY